jgi:glutathione synthase/RimK-type ligase-like ATP-grasp enzyme
LSKPIPKNLPASIRQKLLNLAKEHKDDSGLILVQRFLPMESKKIGTIVRYERVVVLANSGHELPVF